MEDGLTVRAHELHRASADLGGKATRHLGEELADTGVQLADVANVGRGGGQHRGDLVPQVVGVRHRPTGDKLALEHVGAVHEIGQHRLDRVEGGAGDHADHPHRRPPGPGRQTTPITASSYGGRWRLAIRPQGD